MADEKSFSASRTERSHRSTQPFFPAPGNGVASDYEPGHSHYAVLPSRSGNVGASNCRRSPQKPLFVGSRLLTVCRVWLLVNRTDHLPGVLRPRWRSSSVPWNCRPTVLIVPRPSFHNGFVSCCRVPLCGPTVLTGCQGRCTRGGEAHLSRVAVWPTVLFTPVIPAGLDSLSPAIPTVTLSIHDTMRAPR
jgi:hypothetical protein